MGDVVAFSPPIPEADAADRLGVSPTTLQRARKRGEIAYYRIGQKKICYGERHLMAYLEERECATMTKTDPAKSADIGSASDEIPTPGAAPGTTSHADRRAAQAFTRQILTEQK